MPAEQGNDAERFAAALEQGRPPRSADAELQHDLEIVAMLRSRAAAYDPHPDAKARAKQRLMAALAAEQNGAGVRPAPRPVAPSPVDATAPLGRLFSGAYPADADATSTTTQIPAVQLSQEDESPAETEQVPGQPAGTPITIGRSRRGRHTMPSRPSRLSGSQRPERPSMRRRVMLVGAAALLFMVALAGGGIFASRNALPGDSLYAAKRAAESAGLALTFDDATKARRQLELAATRLDEIERMAKAQQHASADPALFRAAMQDFDNAAGEGSRMLLSGSSASNAAALAELRSWASTQAGRLQAISPTLPPQAKSGAADSINLLDRLRGRAAALEGRTDCTEVTSGAVDDLGALPAEGTCAPRQADPNAKPSRPGSTARGSGKPGSPTAGPAAGPGPSSESTPAPEDPATTGGLLSGLDDPGLGLPSKVGSGDNGGQPSTTPSKTRDNVSIPLPLPLLPPITLPPLLPGQPGITIG